MIVRLAVLYVAALCFAVVFYLPGLAQTRGSPQTIQLTEEEIEEKNDFFDLFIFEPSDFKSVSEMEAAVKKWEQESMPSGRPEFLAHLRQEIEKRVQPIRNSLMANERAGQRQQQANETVRYAAVAISAKGAGWVRDQKTKEAAEEKARKQCGKADCDAKSFSTGCAGIYRFNYKEGRKKVFGFGYVRRADEGLAKQDAMGVCLVRNPSGCVIVTTVCQVSAQATSQPNRDVPPTNQRDQPPAQATNQPKPIAPTTNKQDQDDCDQSDNLDRSIAACTRIVQNSNEKKRERAIGFGTRGLRYAAKGDDDRAIADYSEAIQLELKDADVFHARGLAYSRKGDLDRAIADYSEAIRLEPKRFSFYVNRGVAYRRKGDYDGAIANHSEGIRVLPEAARLYFERARANLYGGSLPKALADVSRTRELVPKDLSTVLLLDIIGQRSGLPSRLPQAIATIDMTVWPAPIIRMFMGQLTPAAVLAAADDPDATKKRKQFCDANFYSGLLALRQDAKVEAARLFRLAANDCPRDTNQWIDANAELKALGEKP